MLMDNDQASAQKVLCIEDEPFISELYTRSLQKAGYSVKVVADGVEALKEAETDDYDIILLDLMIPNLGGVDVLRQLRSPSRDKPIRGKIVIITNLEQRDEARAEVEKLADGYLVKAELTPKQLAEYLAKLN